MRNLAAKTFALTAIISLGALMSGPAHAALVRSSSGAPVTTKDGACLTSGWEGAADCEAAKQAAGIATEKDMPCDHDDGAVVYFDFNKATLTPQARNRLDHLAHRLRWEHEHMEHADRKDHKHPMQKQHRRDENITIVGYADRLGNAAYNHRLAKKRADAVRDYLVSKGAVDKHTKVEVRSLGSEDAHSSCPADMPRARLIRCLRTDRRVEIELGRHD